MISLFYILFHWLASWQPISLYISSTNPFCDLRCENSCKEILFHTFYAPTIAEGEFDFTLVCLCVPKLVSILKLSLPQLNVIKLIQNAYYHKTQIKFEFWWHYFMVVELWSFTNGKNNCFVEIAVFACLKKMKQLLEIILSFLLLFHTFVYVYEFSKCFLLKNMLQ